MMTIKRRLLAYAKQTSRTAFTPAQLRRTISKARTQVVLLALSGELDENNQDHLDAVTLATLGRNQTVITRIVTR
jgi:hypothetical protein